MIFRRKICRINWVMFNMNTLKTNTMFNRDIEKIFKNLQTKKINIQCLDKFSYEQQIQRRKELALLQIKSRSDSIRFFKFLMNIFNQRSIYERQLELTNLRPIYFDKTILTNLFISNFYVKKKRSEIVKDLLRMKESSEKYESKMKEDKNSEVINAEPGSEAPCDPAICTDWVFYTEPSPKIDSDKDTSSNKRKATEDSGETRDAKKPRIATEFDKYVSRLIKKLNQCCEKLSQNKIKGTKFWDKSDEIIIDCLECDLQVAKTTGNCDRQVKDVNVYYQYMKRKYKYGEYLDCISGQKKFVDNKGKKINVSTLLLQIKHAINQHCPDCVQYYIKKKSDKTCVIIPKNERKIALFSNHYISLFIKNYWNTFNKVYTGVHAFSGSIELQKIIIKDEIIQERINLMNTRRIV